MNLEVIYNKGIKKIDVLKGENILDILRKNDIYINSPCGGKGNCGKCKIKVQKGFVLINNNDRKFLTESELYQGYRIACKSSIIEDTVICLAEEENFQIVDNNIQSENIVQGVKNKYNIIIDIGTTTVCVQLTDNSGKCIKSISSINPQRSYGLDVITRITEACAGNGEKLSNIIKNCLTNNIKKIISDININNIDKVYISANTTMIYLLLNMDCSDIGIYPFKITTNEVNTLSFYDVFGESIIHCNVIILPCISAFVGADIVSGGILCDLINNKNSILIDIGTNGEMILNSNGILYSTSTAAGPAFEGGNILFGVGSIEGAISSVKYVNKEFQTFTIGNKEPIGICGSGVIDAIACFIENQFIDKTGLIKDEFFDNGINITKHIKIIQNDIRAFQMAKAAIRAGIETIIISSGINLNDIKNVYISGGFGFFINIDSAIKTCLLPSEFSGKIKTVGNSSLGGMSKIINQNNIGDTKIISSTCKVIGLANNELFNELFIKYIDF